MWERDVSPIVLLACCETGPWTFGTSKRLLQQILGTFYPSIWVIAPKPEVGNPRPQVRFLRNRTHVVARSGDNSPRTRQ